MGKGKRNQQLRVEDTMGAPEKRQNKKQFTWPVWAKRALCIVLLVAVLAGIVFATLITSGTILRNRIIVESKSGKFDVNQQMATFILWYVMYDQAYSNWSNAYYSYYIYGDTSSGIDFSLYQSPSQYGLAMASYYTKEALNSGLYSIKDYLIQLVAGADAAVMNENMKYTASDRQKAENFVTEIKNIYIDFGFGVQGMPFKNFLTEYIGTSIKTKDIKDAAKLWVMYSKYSGHKSFELQGNVSDDALQDFILRNPANSFEGKLYTLTGAEEAMIRSFFTDEFMNERFESTIAKHYANATRLAIVDLKDEELTEARKNHQLNDENVKEYTKTTTDGKDSYSPDTLPEALGEYIFSASNKAGTFAAISGDKCAYLVYFKETASSTKAKIAFETYTYDDCKTKIVEDMKDDSLATIDAIKAELTNSIIKNDNTTAQQTDNLIAKYYLELWKKSTDPENNVEFTLPEGVETKTGVKTTKPLTSNDTNEAPKSILDALYKDGVTPYAGWAFTVNNDNESYFVRVTAIEEGTTNYTINYAKFVDDPFPALLRTFEAEFELYILESKVTAPKLDSMTFDELEESFVKWLLDAYFNELVLTKHAKDDFDKIDAILSDSNEEAKEENLNKTLAEIFMGEEDRTYEDTYSEQINLDSNVYDYIFNTNNKGKAKVIVGKDDRVFLVYVFEDEHEGHGHATDNTVVQAGIKEYRIEDYADDLQFKPAEDEEVDEEEIKTFRDMILNDLLGDDRENTTEEKSAEDLAEQAIKDLTKETPDTWEPEKTLSTKLPAAKEADDKNEAPKAIIDKIYPKGNSTTAIELEVNKFYQVDADGTSYVLKVTKINDDLSCDIEYKSFEDSDYYGYFRAIKSKLDASLSEESKTEKYPSSITDGDYLDWFFKSEYKAAEGDTKSHRDFERKENDLTFIDTTEDEDNVKSFTLYLVDEPVKQIKNGEDQTVYGSYILFETEKDAQKALKKLKNKTGFELLDIFGSFKTTSEVTDEEYNKYLEEEALGKKPTFPGYPGYLTITSATQKESMKKTDVTDAGLKEWFFASDRSAYEITIMKQTLSDADAKDGKVAGYYLAVFVSSDVAWRRTAISGVASELLEAHMENLVAEGNYEINEKAMAKIDGVVTEAVTDK